MADVSINSGVLGALNSLNTINNRIALTEQRISGGQRINSASDDAAGLVIRNRIDARAGGFNQAIRNAGDGISLTQTTEGSLSGVNDALSRINELSLQSANGILNDSDRQSLQKEVDSLVEGINSMIDNTQFNGRTILNDDSPQNFAIDPNAAELLAVEGTDLSDLQDQLNNIDIGTQAGAQAAIDVTAKVSEEVTAERARVGAVQNRFETTINSLQIGQISEQATRSRISDADIAKESSERAQELVRRDAGLAIIAQANSNADSVLQLLSL